MIAIPLASIPNQAFSIQLDNLLYDFTIKFFINIMSVTIVRSGVTILSNIRATPNMPLIPYKYLENGNFIIASTDDSYPNYNNFEIDQFLLYFNQAELEAIRAGI